MGARGSGARSVRSVVVLLAEADGTGHQVVLEQGHLAQENLLGEGEAQARADPSTTGGTVVKPHRRFDAEQVLQTLCGFDRGTESRTFDVRLDLLLAGMPASVELDQRELVRVLRVGRRVPGRQRERQLGQRPVSVAADFQDDCAELEHAARPPDIARGSPRVDHREGERVGHEELRTVTAVNAGRPVDLRRLVRDVADVGCTASHSQGEEPFGNRPDETRVLDLGPRRVIQLWPEDVGCEVGFEPRSGVRDGAIDDRSGLRVVLESHGDSVSGK